MKKLFAVILTVFMLCSVMTSTAFAAKNYVVSPEKEDVDVDPEPVAPQTGYENELAGAAVIALACGAVAIVSVKKVREYRA